MTSVDLLSFLNLVKQNNFSEIKNILSDYPEILKILELLGVLSIISSDLPLNIELTPLGSIILSNEDIKVSLQEHDKMLHSISTDIQRIKSSLSAISLDVVRSQGLAQDSTYGSDFLLEKEQNFKRDSSIKQPESNSSKVSNRIKSINIDDLRTYVSEVRVNLSPQELNQLNRSINRIKSTYGNTTSFIQQGKFQEFGIESFLVIDSIFIVLLKIFNQKDPSILSLSLEKKYNLLKNLPLTIDLDLVLFLDRINSDMQNNTEDALKIGEKTAKRIFSLINDIYKPFISIFEVFS